ncbi:MAG: LysE family transporter [Roseivirga sp.]|nr:LysE family transporter [Roseivirga sp.]
MIIWHIFEAFFLATLISFVASIQLGPVNYGTIRTALNKNKKAAILFGFGGSLPELLYCSLAFGGSNLLIQYEGLGDYLKYLTIGVLLVFGIYTFFQKPSEGGSKTDQKSGKEVWRGMTFGLLNPQLFPYWLFVITLLRGYNLVTSPSWFVQGAFVVGTAVGAFLLQYLVAVVTTRKREFIYTKLTTNYNKVFGTILIALALATLVIDLL